MPKIAIFDYGAGNLFNLQQSLLRNGAHADIVDTLRKIEDYDGKVPHMGWNNLETIRKDSKLLDGIKEGSWVYFVHSYRINPTDKSIVVATSQYGGTLSAAMEQENVFGTQFHPEKSGAVGSRIIRNYIEMCSGKK